MSIDNIFKLILEKIRDFFLEDESVRKYFKDIAASVKNIDAESKIKSENITLRSNIDKYAQKIIFYEKNYKILDDIYSNYCDLCFDTKNRLENVFGGNNPIAFFVGAIQENNIIELWKFIKERIKENEHSETDLLQKIFVSLLNLFNSGKKAKEYCLISPELGEKYNDKEQHIIGTETDGKIKEVLLVGFKNIKTGKIYKAMVTVK